MRKPELALGIAHGRGCAGVRATMMPLSGDACAPEARSGATTTLRPLLLGQAVSSVGDGLWITLGIIYLTQVAHFATTTVGFTVAAANVAGIALAYPAGVLADRTGARRVLVGLTIVRGIAAAAICVVSSVPMLLVICVAFYGTQGASNGVRTALVCAAVDGESRMTMLARIRVAQHVAYAAGAGLGAVVLAIGHREAYFAAFLANAATFAVLAVLTLRVPEPRAARVAAEVPVSSTALRDYPYQLAMFVTALFALCWAMLTTGFPLWLADSTIAPKWLAAVAIFASSAAISVLQLRFTRYATPARVDRCAVFAGLLLAGSCLVLASASWANAPAATLLVLAAVFLHIPGELFFVAVRWRLSVDLMDPRHVGAYQGAAATSEATMLASGPAVLALVVTAPGIAGWVLLAAAFVATGIGTVPLRRYAASRRPSGDPLAANTIR
ncbi:MFS transporter [Nocardia brasiliensis]